MSKPLPASIEFINGPFDGHVELVSSSVERLPGSIVCYVSENVFRLFEGLCRLPSSAFTSVAVYQREDRGDRTTYRFAGAIAPEAMKLEPAVRLSKTNKDNNPAS